MCPRLGSYWWHSLQDDLPNTERYDDAEPEESRSTISRRSILKTGAFASSTTLLGGATLTSFAQERQDGVTFTPGCEVISHLLNNENDTVVVTATAADGTVTSEVI